MKTWAIKHKQTGKYAVGSYIKRGYVTSLVLAQKYATRKEARWNAFSCEKAVNVEVTAREL